MRKRWDKKKAVLGIAALGSLYLGMALAAKRTAENRNMDADNSNVEKAKAEKSARPVTAYEESVKPAMDKLLSFAGLVVLSPLFAVISAAIVIDDPGPVFFMQKRVGKDRQFFSLHKFRTMKMETPHDVPTHQLEHPEQYITRVGRLLRRTSLDELPQMWDIFRGEMSIVGPRPALWNQEDLIAERDRYGANDVKPGLTGWAQVNGRDELFIEEKARLDGEYVNKLGIEMDMKCILGTVLSVLKQDGIVEGGTGASAETKNRECSK